MKRLVYFCWKGYGIVRGAKNLKLIHTFQDVQKNVQKPDKNEKAKKRKESSSGVEKKRQRTGRFLSGAHLAFKSGDRKLVKKLSSTSVVYIVKANLYFDVAGQFWLGQVLKNVTEKEFEQRRPMKIRWLETEDEHEYVNGQKGTVHPDSVLSEARIFDVVEKECNE